MAMLIGMSGDVKGRDFQINRSEITIGRRSDNTIILDNPTVSGNHCSLVQENDRFLLRDLNSTNGTRVNSREITESHLKTKDLVQVGSVEFLFDEEATENAEAGLYARADVVEAQGAATVPISFGSISPFGARRKESKGLWYVLIVLVGALALVGVLAFFITLLTTG